MSDLFLKTPPPTPVVSDGGIIEPSKPKFKKKFLIVLTIVVLIALGFWVWIATQSETEFEELTESTPTGINSTTNLDQETTTNNQQALVDTPSVATPPASTPTFTTNPDGQTFSSNKMGIAFFYPNNIDNGNGLEAVKTYEVGNKTYVYVDDDYSPGYESGQSIEMFLKDPNDSLENAINKQFLSGIPTSECFIEEVNFIKDPHPGMNKLIINYPIVDPEIPYENENCPSGYRASNGISYFLMDPKHPDRYYYLSIGQYNIQASNSDPDTSWQSTLQIIPIR